MMKNILKKIVALLRGCAKKRSSKNQYYKRFNKYAFVNGVYKNEQQYEAQIIKMYHSVEKGLAYKDFRAGFGRKNIEQLISAMHDYSEQYDTEAFFYKTALSVLDKYISKNEAYGNVDAELNNRIRSLPGTPNECGGTVAYRPFEEMSYTNYEEFVLSRHSVREFSNRSVDLEVIKEAITLAQNTPSACNRQGWKTRIIVDKDAIKTILANQNGNKGFGESIDKLLIITSDLRCFSKGRELYHPYIDGGMYSMNVLHALHSKNIATIPLSAALREEQELAVRACAKIDEAEVLVLFVGVGNYNEETVTTKSHRHEARIEIV